jgi:DNA-binding transcriptional MerR regulator
MVTVASVTIPNRPVFRAQEVCDIAQVQLYVLRTWEAEFPDLGVAKTANGQRVYRRADVERVLKLKHLLCGEGLTLAGARRRLIEEGAAPPAEDVSDEDVAALVDDEMRQGLTEVRRGLHWMLGVLSGDGVSPEDFVLVADPASRARAKTAKASTKKAAARPAAKAKKSGKSKKR